MTVTVVTPAESKRLTHIDKLKGEIGISTSDTSKDYIFNSILDQASAIITSYCKRQFAKEVVKETVKSYGSAILVLSRAPIISITSIKSIEDGVTIPSSEYLIENADSGFVRNKSNSWKWAVTNSFGVLNSPKSGSEYSYYEATYEAGYILPSFTTGVSNLPEDIERACIEICKLFWFSRNRDLQIQSENIQGVYSVTYSDVDMTDNPRIKALLAPWKRVII